jgi:hypothetical protein
MSAIGERLEVKAAWHTHVGHVEDYADSVRSCRKVSSSRCEDSC